MTSDLERLEESLGGKSPLEKEFKEFLIDSAKRWEDHKEMKILIFDFENVDSKTVATFMIRAIKGGWTFVVTVGEVVCVEKYTSNVRRQIPGSKIRSDI